MLTRTLISASSSRSRSSIAMEYASSPVAQPGTQTLIDSPAEADSISGCRALLVNASNAAGSRKKLVTEIRNSRNSCLTSSGSSRSRSE